MGTKQDAKQVFEWAKQNGDVATVERILVKIMPELVKNGMKLTDSSIESSSSVEVSKEMYDLILQKAQELVGSSYKS